MHTRIGFAWNASLIVGLTLLAGLAAPGVRVVAAEQSLPSMQEVGGPGQAVDRPMPACPRTLSCQLSERNFLPDGYRVQAFLVCGANCTTQYWVSDRADGQALLEIDPVRGGGILAVSGGAPADRHPPVRVVVPSYAAGDPACCPSGFADTTYTWDSASGVLVAGDATVTPASDFPGWDAVRQELLAEGFSVAS